MSKEWQRVHNMRKGYINKWSVKIQRSLKLQAVDVVKELGVIPPHEVVERIDGLIHSTVIREDLKRLYPDVGVHFARATLTRKAQDPIYDIWEAEMRSYAENDVFMRLRMESMTVTSQNLARKVLKKLILEETLEQGMGIEEIAKRFQKRFSKEYGKYDLWRARRIAQTEVISASNKGNHLAMYELGAVGKRWLTGGRPETIRHQGYPGLEGQERAVNEPFYVGGYPAQYPGDPGLPPEESINCHCVSIPIT